MTPPTMTATAPVETGQPDPEQLLTLWGELDDLREFAEMIEAEAFRSRIAGRGDRVTLDADDCAYLAACCRAIERAVHEVVVSDDDDNDGEVP